SWTCSTLSSPLNITASSLQSVPTYWFLRDLSFNKLSGPIPSILGNLTYIEKLYLQGNSLTGSIPPELGNMSTLHY
ncbi:hypothetical protein ABZP36_019879, partial [Zizania latifolia]